MEEEVVVVAVVEEDSGEAVDLVDLVEGGDSGSKYNRCNLGSV